MRAAQHGARYVQRLKWLTGPPTYDKRPCSLNRVVHQTLSLFRDELSRRGIITESLLSPSIPDIVASEDALTQACMNLILNAKEAMPAGGKLVFLSRTSDSRDAVELICADTGQGIPPGHLPRIFDPWFTTKRPGYGTGIGLHVVRESIMALGGDVTVQSIEGKGATFTITLPTSCTERQNGQPKSADC